MDRRAFLKFLGLGTAGAAAAALTPAMLEGFVPDPERLLWEPGQRTILLPPEKTFTLYSPEDLRSLERAMGVLRFYDARGTLRLDQFNTRNPHEVDKLTVLSDQEVRLAIETGYDLTPGYREHNIRLGAYDGQGSGRVETGHGYLTTDHSRFMGTLQPVKYATRVRNEAPTWSTRRTAGRGQGSIFGDVEIEARDARRHGQSLIDANGDTYRDIVTTEATDSGMVTIGHRERKGY